MVLRDLQNVTHLLYKRKITLSISDIDVLGHVFGSHEMMFPTVGIPGRGTYRQRVCNATPCGVAARGVAREKARELFREVLPHDRA